MKSFMYDLYFGNLVPWESGRPKHPDYTPINRKISEIKEHFKELLPTDEYKRFEEIEDLQAESGTIEDSYLFEYGFCMGVLMMIDVFDFKEKRITKLQSE